MINNDVLRSLRHKLHVNETKLVEIVGLGGATVTVDEIHTYLKREDEAGFVECPNEVLARFLNGLVLFKRGPKENAAPHPEDLTLTNNVVLKKIRVAFELQDHDLTELLKKAGFAVSKTEMSAFFRKPDHRNYRPCGDQFLRNLLKGLNT